MNDLTLCGESHSVHEYRPIGDATLKPDMRIARLPFSLLAAMDKGPEKGISQSNMPAVMSPRAAARMAARGARYNPAVDRPIYPLYRDEVMASGLIIRAECRWLNALSGTIEADRLAALSSLDCVDSLRPVAESEFQLPEPETTGMETPKPEVPSGGEPYDYGPSLNQILAIQADQLHAVGLDGTGVRIGFLDTGFSLDIDAFVHLHLIATRDFINGDDDVGDGDSAQMSHGTMTLSTC
ncbi:MAG: hypothetical protein HY304_06610, partial [candidate division Zixibacteria bacterium]|nr:hypothetical protein [candidate division Zixibacteria bacterium]